MKQEFVMRKGNNNKAETKAKARGYSRNFENNIKKINSGTEKRLEF